VYVSEERRRVPRLDAQQQLMPSILDRLMDPESRAHFDLQALIHAVRRDLEDLLNTRQTTTDLPAHYEELHNSLYTYGLPDLNSLNAATQEERAAIGGVIETMVGRFEPRLKDIHVHLVQGSDEKKRSIAFHIEAKLNADPAPEVAFETILELTTGHYQVKPAGS
jgi:type VI secretion system protein ImpF